jgi:hypothetical protein
MNILQKTGLITALITIATFANSPGQPVHIGGTTLGVFNHFNQQQTQFDFAVNINMAYDIAPHLVGIVELQTSPGNGTLGFEGPNTSVTDLALIYTLNSAKYVSTITFGSFDTPFGHETQFLSNNAHTFNNLFIINSLTYSAMAGPMGTLNTLGVKIENRFKNIDIITSISNGTSETAHNENKTFETLAQLSFHSSIKGLRITGSYLNSDDSHDTKDSFQTDLTATLLEINYFVFENIELKYKSAEFKFDNKTTQNNTLTLTNEFEINYTAHPVTFGLRMSLWRPQGKPVSLAMQAPGLIEGIPSTIDRFQLGVGFYIYENTLFKAELVHEQYVSIIEKNTTRNTGLISGINVRF